LNNLLNGELQCRKKDVILGKIYFLLVRIKIKYMELAVIRREPAGIGANSINESENIVKHELMDGAPIKGECVPIRLFLSHLDLTPTYRSVNNVFSVKYYLNLVLVDEEDRRYFKQQEVVFWRKSDDSPDPVRGPTGEALGGNQAFTKENHRGVPEDIGAV
jgi:vacuolar protein sorting-associated protein 26